MALPGLENHIREITALAKQQRDTLTAAAVPRQPAGSTAAMTFAVGSKVLDLVTGEIGVVIDGHRRNTIVSTP